MPSVKPTSVKQSTTTKTTTSKTSAPSSSSAQKKKPVSKTAPVAEAPTKVEAPVQAKVEAPVPEQAPVVSKDETQPEGSLSDEFGAMSNAMTALQKQLRDLQTQFKNLQRRVNKEHRELEKAGKGRRKKGGVAGVDKPKRAPSGFAKPTRLSPELCVFLGIDPSTEMARTAVTKQITTYVKEHNLQNQDNKKIILPDDALGKLLNVPAGETLTYFNLQKFMKVHFKKAGEA